MEWHIIPISIYQGAKGIRCASTFWAAVGAGKLADEVEACPDIL